MDDEQFGRAWAKQQGCAPLATHDERGWPRWAWHIGDLDSACRPPDAVLAELDGPLKGRTFLYYQSEAAVYAALGAAVRAVHAAVPPLADPDYSVRKHTPEGQLAGLLACCRAAVESPGNPVVLAELRLWLARFEKGDGPRRGPMTLYVQCPGCGDVVKTDLPPGCMT